MSQKFHVFSRCYYKLTLNLETESGYRFRYVLYRTIFQHCARRVIELSNYRHSNSSCFCFWGANVAELFRFYLYVFFLCNIQHKRVLRCINGCSGFWQIKLLHELNCGINRRLWRSENFRKGLNTAVAYWYMAELKNDRFRERKLDVFTWEWKMKIDDHPSLLL